MSEAARVDPFASLDDFAPAPVARPKLEVEAVRKASEANNFVSRAPGARVKAAEKPPVELKREQRRHRTGRNLQINIKATAQTLEHLTRLSNAHQWAYGETLAKALQALEVSLTATK